MGGSVESKDACHDPTLAESKKKYLVVSLESEYAKVNPVLVRSTNHGIDQNGETVCLTVKSDYLPALGAEVCFGYLFYVTGIFLAIVR
jgi:hypothetical protein